MFRHSANNAGFTILEVVIAGTIGMVMTLGVIAMASMSSKVNRGTELSAEQLDLNALIRTTLLNPPTCTANLAGEVLDLTTLSAKPIIPCFTNVDPANPSQLIKGTPIVSNKKFGKIEVDDFLLAPLTAVGPSTWLVRVKVSTHKTGNFTGPTDGASAISLQVKIDPATSKIIKCLDNSKDDFLSLSSDDALSERVCELSSGGALIYDPTTATCVPNLNCFSGTADAATCPTGNRITGCNSIGWSDPSAPPPITRAIAGSTQVLSQAAPVFECDSLIDRTTNSVKCVYAQGVITTGAQCQACCLSITAGGF